MRDTMGKALGLKERVDINGKEYTISPITVGVFEQLETRVRQKRRRAVKDIIEDLPVCPERMEMVREHSRPVTSIDVNMYIASPEGMMYTVWLCISVNHPDFTYDEFKKLDKGVLDNLIDTHEDLKEGDEAKN